MGAILQLPIEKINYERREDINLLRGHIVDEEGSISNIPIQMPLSNLEAFINIFEKNYLVFRNHAGEDLFEVSEGIICVVHEESGLTKQELVKAFYRNGLKIVK
ncbi:MULTISPECIES: hypothetical protein [Pseudobacillus]|uniref:hypothetical protein n=1 Tax=Pseudobacillus TaxID=108525 RepID=UPI00387A34BE